MKKKLLILTVLALLLWYGKAHIQEAYANLNKKVQSILQLDFLDND